MINVAAIRMQQFGVQFYQASLTAKDIDKLVRFEVLSYGEQAQGPGLRGSARPALGEEGAARSVSGLRPWRTARGNGGKWLTDVKGAWLTRRCRAFGAANRG